MFHQYFINIKINSPILFFATVIATFVKRLKHWLMKIKTEITIMGVISGVHMSLLTDANLQ